MELLTVAETAAYLKVSTVTVRRYIASKRLPCVRVGRNIRVRREDVESLPDAGPEPDIFGPPYFDAGYPGERDQFISMAAASWATTRAHVCAGCPPARGRACRHRSPTAG